MAPVESLVKPILSPFHRNSFATALASYFTEWDFFRASSRGDERIRVDDRCRGGEEGVFPGFISTFVVETFPGNSSAGLENQWP